MYQVLIVDDEPLMRKYMEYHLAKIDSRFIVSAVASDGREALDKLELYSFDLVITDIKMPEVDGLELAKYIQEKYKDIKVVIVSGFGEFEYARQALRYGVDDYLLKPIADKDIAQTLQQLAIKLDDIRKSKNIPFVNTLLNKLGTTNESWKVMLNQEETWKDFLHTIITEQASAVSYLYAKMKQKDKLREEKQHQILLLWPDIAEIALKYKSYQSVLECKLNLYNMVCEELDNGEDYILCMDKEKRCVIWGCERNPNYLEQRLQKIFNTVNVKFYENYDLHLLGSIGSTVTSILRLEESYHSAIQVQVLNLLESNGAACFKNYVSQTEFIQQAEAILENLHSAIETSEIDQVNLNLTRYIDLLPLNINARILFRFMIHLIGKLGNQHTKANLAMQFLLENFNTYTCDSILESEVIYDILKKLVSLFLTEEGKELEGNQLAERAKEYICRHYKEQISLSQVAEKLNISLSYLSEAFHRGTGESYTKYLQRIRMEQAATLLTASPNVKIYSIAQSTGYVSVKHFNTVFKQYYQRTPKEFQKEYFMKNK